ncbi:hypothetical protein V2O64_22480 [Verrucomicrobiaceae bacterium 227]
MKHHHIALSSAWITITLPALATLVPNGDFETANGALWEEANGEGSYLYSYPTNGGNPTGYGIINNSGGGGGYGLLVATNSGAPLTLASLALTAGKSYTFSQDMILQSGRNIGGLKVDFFNGTDLVGTTNDLRSEAIDGGSSWHTYNYQVSIPTNADGVKIVSLWGADSSVGFDNIAVDATPIELGAIPNRDFQFGKTLWSEMGAGTTWAYPAEGGNPGSYGVMTNEGAGFGIWVANGNNPISLSALGLEPGTSVTFQQDMILLAGDSIGGLKIDFFNGSTLVSDSTELTATLIGNGSTWETYSFPITLPAGIDGIKIVPLRGANIGSSVGYDNFRVSVATPRIEANGFPRFSQGTIVSWTPTHADLLYQPQWSIDGNLWTDFGPAYPGTETTSLLDPNSSPFYRVVEKASGGQNVLVNGGFETPDFADPELAESWTFLSGGGQLPQRTESEAFSGSASVRLVVQNDASAAPNKAEIQQNLIAVGGSLTGGETYSLSFRAKQVSFGVSYVQQYRLQWFDGSGMPIAGTEIGFNNFVGGNGSWAEILVSNIVAPPNAAGSFIEIFGATGAVVGAEAKGEVLIDDITLAIGGPAETVILETTTTPGSGIVMLTKAGTSYQAQESDDLRNFNNLSGVFIGNGQPVGAGIPDGGPSHFYRIREVALALD